MSLELLPEVEKSLQEPQKMFIDGDWANGVDGKTFASIDPGTGESLVEVAEAGGADVDRAVEAARTAVDTRLWSGLQPSQRAQILWSIADGV